ncbi:hypothetical protein QQP08_027706 [Theobroma cacao]|nr:hypothetical protein QQP08_024509 [Theobroma cacao]WRX35219.1 hypothetical protein QQP08_027706 [Theobroma cacao]
MGAGNEAVLKIDDMRSLHCRGFNISLNSVYTKCIKNSKKLAKGKFSINSVIIELDSFFGVEAHTAEQQLAILQH